MIVAILKSYLFLLLPVILGACFLFIIGLYFIFRKPQQKSFAEEMTQAFSKDNLDIADVADFAGDDVLTTQLDLARAYIETGKEHLAKNILQTVIAKGNMIQQKEAHSLLSHL